MSQRRSEDTLTRLLDEAARIVIEEGVNDYRRAKRKAARHLGLEDGYPLPPDEAVEAAVLAHRRVFPDAQRLSLRRQREVALGAMTLLESFQPRLVGPVLTGAAGAHEAVTLHLFTDSPEEVEWFLHDRAIPFEVEERRLSLGKRGVARLPVLCFMAGETPLELVVLPSQALRQPPSRPGDTRPLPRLGLKGLRALLAEEGGEVQNRGG